MKKTTKLKAKPAPIFAARLVKISSGEEYSVYIHVLSRNNKISVYPTNPNSLPGYYEVFDSTDHLSEDWSFNVDENALNVLTEYFSED